MNKNIYQEIKSCYKAFLKTNKNLNFYIILQIIFILISRSTVALSTLSFTYFINKHLNINIVGSLSIGVIFFYCINKISELLFSILQIRFYSEKILPTSLNFIDKMIEEALVNYNHFKLDKTPVELSVLLNKKTEARNFLGYLFNHMLNPFLELVICTLLLIHIGFGLLGFLLIPACLIYFSISVFLLPLVKKQMNKIIDLSAKQNHIFSLSLNKTDIATVFGTTKLLANHLNTITKEETKEYKKQLIINDVMFILLNIPLVIFSCLFFYFGAMQVLHGGATYGAFAGFISIILTSFSQFKNLTFAFDGLNQSLSALSFPIKIFNQCNKINKKSAVDKNSIVNIDSLEILNFQPTYLKKEKNLKLKNKQKVYIMGF